MQRVSSLVAIYSVVHFKTNWRLKKLCKIRRWNLFCSCHFHMHWVKIQ